MLRRVSDGTRTRGHLDHNQELYQLSYTHHVRMKRVSPVLRSSGKCSGHSGEI